MKSLFIILVLLTLSAVGGFFWWSKQLEPVAPGSTQQVSIVIPKNQPAGVVVEDLVAKGVIRSGLAGKIYLRVANLASQIQPGAYVVSPSQTMQAILVSLTQGPQDIWVTIPEGWRREQIAARLDANLNGPNKSFVMTDFLTQTATLEGQLFPDTYLIPAVATAEQVIAIMLANFAAKSDLTLPADKNTLIVASLVERESRTDSERPTVAGIIWKRLNAGWALNIDATVQYAQGTAADWWPQNINTRQPSKYNTYLNAGLPPTPISNPGLASIQAAINPLATAYWYYLHAPDGQVYFATTLEEHNLNVDKYLR